jgi:ferric-chelate reductase [NAD(P)H]
MDIRQRVLDQCSYGLYVVTSRLEGKLNGQISDALMQVTAFPPRVAVSINKEELTHEYISGSGVFAASILGRSAGMPFIGLFGFRSGRDVDKLSQVEHRIGESGCPLVTQQAVAVFEARVLEAIDVGTHTLFVGDVLAGEMIEEGEILTYSYYTHVMKGRVPKNSPSYGGAGASPAP